MTIATIVAGLESVLDDVSGVDQTSIDVYIPAASTQGSALIIPPLGQSSVYSFRNLSASTARVVHRIPCEFWTKVSTGALATTLASARDIGRLATIAIMAGDSTNGYELETGEDITVSVTEVPVVVGDMAYIVTTVTVPVWEDVNV